MKRILTAYLSLSLALTPALVNAQTAKETQRETQKETPRAEMLMQSEIAKLKNAFKSKGIKVLEDGTTKEISLEKGIESGRFVVDATSAKFGIIRVEKLLATEGGQIAIALAKLNSRTDMHTDKITSVIIDAKLTADENKERIYQSLQNLALNDSMTRTVATENERPRAAIFMTGLIFVAGGALLAKAATNSYGMGGKKAVAVYATFTAATFAMVMTGTVFIIDALGGQVPNVAIGKTVAIVK